MRRRGWILGLVVPALLFGGCRTALLDPTAPRGDAATSEDAAVVPIYRPVPIAPRPGQAFEAMLADVKGTTGAFGVAWTEYQGGYGIGVAIVDGKGEEVATRVLLGPKSDVGSPRITWSDKGLVVFWTWRDGTHLRIYMARLRFDGTLDAAPQVIRDWSGDAADLISASWSAETGLFRVLFIDDRTQKFVYLPYFLSIREDGTVERVSEALSDVFDGTLYVGAGGTRAHLLRIARPAMPNDNVASLFRFDDRGVPVAAPREIHRAKTLHAGTTLSSGDDYELGLWDVSRGALLARLAGAVAPRIIDLGAEYERPALAMGTGASGAPVTVALLPTHRPGLPAARLSYRVVSGDDSVGPVVRLDSVPVKQGGCVEAHRIAFGAGVFAAFWQENCGVARAAYFLRLGNP